VRQRLATGSFGTGVRLGLGLLAVVAVALFVRQTWAVVQPLLIAGVLATALWPWVGRVSRPFGPDGRRLPRPLAVALIYVTTSIAAGALLWIAVVGSLPILERLTDEFPGPTAEVRVYLDAFRAGGLESGARRVVEDAAAGTSVAEPERPLRPERVAIGLLGGLFTLVLVLIFTFFLLLDGDRLAGWTFQLLPRARRAEARATALRVRDRMSNWILGWLTYGAVSAAIVTVAMLLLRIPEPWLYGVAALALALLPGIGPVLAVIPALVVALGLEPWQPAAVLTFGLAYYIADGAVLAPQLMGRSVRLPTFATLIALFIGAALMGFWGALIATPVAAAVQQVAAEAMRPARGQD